MISQTEKKTKKRVTFTQEIWDEICDVIACTPKGIRKLCHEHPHWPCADTIFSWLKTNKEAADQYARVKQIQVEPLADELLSICDDSSNDIILDDNGKPTCNYAAIQRARLKIDTIKWMISKLCPKIYGNQSQPEATNDKSYAELLRELE